MKVLQYFLQYFERFCNKYCNTLKIYSTKVLQYQSIAILCNTIGTTPGDRDMIISFVLGLLVSELVTIRVDILVITLKILNRFRVLNILGS